MVENNLRRFLYIIFLFLWLIAGGLQQAFAQTDAPARENAGDVPVMVLSDPVFDFGEANEGSEVSHDYIVKNAGKAELLIHKVIPS